MKKDLHFVTRGYGWKSDIYLPKAEIKKAYEQYRQEQLVYHGTKVNIRQYITLQLAFIVFQGTSQICGIRMQNQQSNLSVN